MFFIKIILILCNCTAIRWQNEKTKIVRWKDEQTKNNKITSNLIYTMKMKNHIKPKSNYFFEDFHFVSFVLLIYIFVFLMPCLGKGIITYYFEDEYSNLQISLIMVAYNTIFSILLTVFIFYFINEERKN